MAAFAKALTFVAMAALLLSAQPKRNTLDQMLDAAAREISETQIPAIDLTIRPQDFPDHPIPEEIAPPPKYQRI